MIKNSTEPDLFSPTLSSKNIPHAGREGGRDNLCRQRKPFCLCVCLNTLLPAWDTCKIRLLQILLAVDRHSIISGGQPILVQAAFQNYFYCQISLLYLLDHTSKHKQLKRKEKKKKLRWKTAQQNYLRREETPALTFTIKKGLASSPCQRHRKYCIISMHINRDNILHVAIGVVQNDMSQCQNNTICIVFLHHTNLIHWFKSLKRKETLHTSISRQCTSATGCYTMLLVTNLMKTRFAMSPQTEQAQKWTISARSTFFAIYIRN